MKIKYVLFLLAINLGMTANCQYASVVFDPERNFLNEGQPLPAESHWMLSGPVSDRISLVEVKVYDRPDLEKPLHTARWERNEWSSENRFLIPVDMKLAGNSKYSIVLSFFEPVPSEVTTELTDELNRYLTSYIEESFEMGRNRTKLLKPIGEVMDEMKIIVRRGTANYRSRLQQPFPGFSELVEDKLRKMNETSLSLSRFSIKKAEEDDKGDRKIAYAREQMKAIQDLVSAEVTMHLNREMMIMRDRAVMSDQVTEKVKHIVALNLGYGGIYNSGTVDDLSYGDAPFLGISFPLGRRATAGRFMSNSSLSAGLFLSNTKDALGRELTGPLIGRPLYGAYGYRVFRIIRVNAGAAVMQQTSNDAQGLDINKVFLSPFIGLSLEINFWLGLDR